MSVTNTSGRRKNAVARIYLSEGSGEIQVNNRPGSEYFCTIVQQHKLSRPFALTDTIGKYNVKANVDGGGITGQVEAVCLAITKALIELNPEWKPVLKADGLTTRDPRMVERKKFGQKKARKRFQFSKR